MAVIYYLCTITHYGEISDDWKGMLYNCFMRMLPAWIFVIGTGIALGGLRGLLFSAIFILSSIPFIITLIQLKKSRQN